ncbi:hypothetical protein AYI70_g388 [Smittium culicis]|uniref:Uncharacterized protein n=1 Tax=Smittium culicis TaxID=133412 RepID=A0A1R1YGY5_9FUNG|nr:hypothetical protein AYI70_g388 [Smittium culicis]
MQPEIETMNSIILESRKGSIMDNQILGSEHNITNSLDTEKRSIIVESTDFNNYMNRNSYLASKSSSSFEGNSESFSSVSGKEIKQGFKSIEREIEKDEVSQLRSEIDEKAEKRKRFLAKDEENMDKYTNGDDCKNTETEFVSKTMAYIDKIRQSTAN